ncbi:ATP-binding protein [Flavobacterium sp. B11]|uniref:ATP-binding protein n=1 Tax=Flavobacterium movens TaxID=214860 RepID=UPI0031D02AC5
MDALVKTKEERLNVLSKVFSPSSPITISDFFFGRIEQLSNICDAINERGQHAILFGERGVGKTSLANKMTESFTNLFPVIVTCNRKDTFNNIWLQALGKVQYSTTTKGIGFKPSEIEHFINLGTYLNPKSENFQSDIIKILNNYKQFTFLFIFDEFDNIINDKTREDFADLIKSFSDNITNSTIVLVGIADDIESLIGNHQSLERCLKQVKMPRMSKKECEEIIDNGLAALDIKITTKVKEKIIEFASGFPHYVHLMCKYGAHEIIKNNKFEFSQVYLNIAIKKGIENTNEQLKSSYRKAIVGTQKWQDIIFACAQSPIDNYNCINKMDIIKNYNIIADSNVSGGTISYNLKQFCSADRGNVLSKIGSGINTRYRFTNPMMRAFVKLKLNSN